MKKEGHLPEPILRVHVGTIFQQHLGDVGTSERWRARVVQCGVARDVRDLGRRARGDEVADDVKVSHGALVWRHGFEPDCTKDSKGDESE